ncbi:MAG: sigma-54-dependent Fis family transcriptional regulator [bacterium]|nr:sigma-54-dependent Fis family transcriptional regulator [bacterium]
MPVTTPNESPSARSAQTQRTTTTLPSSATHTLEDTEHVPALTIVAHPDLERIGERAVLTDLVPGQRVRLSRLEPDFRQLGRGKFQRPLGDLHLSRTPIILRSEAEGEIVVEVPAKGSSLAIDGEKLAGGERRLSRARLARGVVLLLSRRIVLLVHPVGLHVSHTKGDFGLIGESDAIVKLRNQLGTLAKLDYPLLIRGETGTGKELVAQALRQLRKSGPFVTLSLAETPAELASALLFGSEEGAFTDAKQRKGAFREAHGGTLFLDEIGDMPVEVQSMLLRVLESQEVRPLGSERTYKVEVRLIAATDVELEKEVGEQRFRAQLFYRLFSNDVRLPPLRERREDVGRLAVHCLRQELRRLPDAPRLDEGGREWLPAKLMTRLLRYSWPGNVRELRNVVRRIVATAAQADWTIDPATTLKAVEPMLVGPDLGLEEDPSAPSAPEEATLSDPSKGRSTALAREDVVAALEAHNWNVKRTAKDLGIGRTTLYNMLKRWGMRTTEGLSREEIADALAVHEGRPEDAARALKVSLHGLMTCMTRYGLHRKV